MRANYLDFHKDYYAEIKSTEPLKFQENNNGTRQSFETYQIVNMWDKNEGKLRYYAWFYANTITSYVSRKNSKNRKDPLAISYPINIEHTINIQFKESDWDFTNETLEEKNEFFDYSRTVVFDKERKLLSLTYKYKSKRPYVPSDKLSVYDVALKKIEDDTNYGIYRNIESTGKNTNATVQSEVSIFDGYDKTVLSILFLFLILPIISIILWRIDIKRNPPPTDMIFFPVSLSKFFILSIFTFGIYTSYWVYKNFKYIKTELNEHLMPIARGIFDYIWFYSLFSHLVDDSHKRYERNILPNKFIGSVLATIYFFLIFAERVSNHILLGLTIGAIVPLPLVNYVNKINQNSRESVRHNSRWSLSHLTLGLVSIPLLALNMGSTIRILPADTVIPGKQLLSYDVQFLQRKGVVEPGDKIHYFYSDAFLFVRKDGSGFTDEYVFSYWEDEKGVFQSEKANYDEIIDIEVTWSKSNLDNTVIKIILADESSFLMFASPEEKKDKIFVKSLKSHWHRLKKSS